MLRVHKNVKVGNNIIYIENHYKKNMQGYDKQISPIL